MQTGKHRNESTPTYSAYDVFMVREMRLAVLAAVDLVAIEIDIVGETHGPGLGAGRAVFLRDCSQRRRGTSARAECSLQCQCCPGRCGEGEGRSRGGKSLQMIHGMSLLKDLPSRS